MNRDSIDIYWSAWSGPEKKMSLFSFNEPKPLFKHLAKNKYPNSKTETFFSCPAVKDMAENIYTVNNPINSLFEYNNKLIKSKLEEDVQYINLSSDAHPNLIGFGPILVYQSFYIFFAKEPLNARFTNPYFSKTNGDYSLIPGEFDIGQWFRPYPTQYQMWKESGTFKIEKDDPLFYVEFMTNKKINFIKFEMTDELHKYSNKAIEAKTKFPFSRLIDHYIRFNQDNTKDLILKAIDKQN
jgi:hypothetical protein